MHYFFDSAFPSGAYAHSFGFETFATGTASGDDQAAMDWIESYMLHSLWHGDLENVAAIFELGTSHKSQTLAKVRECDALLHASRSTLEGRHAARQLAQSLYLAASRLFGAIFPDQLGGTLREPSSVMGVVALELGWPVRETRLYYLQSQALALTSVLVRHGRIGQFRQLEMMASLRHTAVSLAVSRPRIGRLQTPSQCWQLEFDQIAHQHLSPRLFQS